MFNVGDRVYLRDNKYVDDCGNTHAGDTGTICWTDSNGLNVGVEFDRYVEGHDCGGACKYGYGWYIDLDDLGLIEQEPDPVQPPDLDLLF